MKTKLLLFTLIIVAGGQIVFAQNKSDSDVLDTATIRVLYAFSQQAEKEREQIVITDTMALLVGQNYSEYYDWNKRRNDSIHNELMSKVAPMEKIKNVFVVKDEAALQSQLDKMREPSFMTDVSKGESARIFKNRTKNEIITVDIGPTEGGLKMEKTYLQVTEIIPPQEWTITEDTLTLLGYACQKATAAFRGRNYSAWFTLDIPVGEGPWKLFGLPGMILKAEDTGRIFRFQAIGITQSTGENIQIPTDRKIVSSTLKKLNDYRKNRFKDVSYNFFEGGTLSVFRGRNPVEFNQLEKE